MIANEFANTKQYHIDMQYFYVERTEAQCLTIKNKVSAKYIDILIKNQNHFWLCMNQLNLFVCFCESTIQAFKFTRQHNDE